MKLLTIALLLSLLACGKVLVDPQQKGRSSVGELRPVSANQQLSADEVSRLSLICQAMARKTSVLTSSIPAPNEYIFNVTQSDCDGKMIFTAADFKTSIQPNGSNFFFVAPPTARAFLFPNVETHVNGVLAGVCQTIGSLNGANLPLAKGNGESIYLSTLNTDDCVPAFNELCVRIETASLEGDAYRIHTSEWLKFLTDPTAPRYGFYTDRKITSRGFCSENKFTTSQATLK